MHKIIKLLVYIENNVKLCSRKQLSIIKKAAISSANEY